MAKKKMSLGVIGTAIVMASYGVWKSQENKIKSLIPARVGSFGDIIFQVNSRTVLTPKKLTHTASLEEVKLEIVLRADFGARPRTQLAALHKMLQDGTTAYLIIGGKPVCELPMVITDISETWDTILSRGELWQASVNLTLKEYR